MGDANLGCPFLLQQHVIFMPICLTELYSFKIDIFGETLDFAEMLKFADFLFVNFGPLNLSWKTGHQNRNWLA